MARADRRRPDLEIRRFVAGDEEWTGWLANFPFLPAQTDWQLDYFLQRSGPFLARMPAANRLAGSERAELRTLFALYAGRLRGYQRPANLQGVADVVLTVGSGLLSALEPVFFGLTVFSLVRNHLASGGWKVRKAMLKSLAEYLEELLQ